jgi:CheY-like chemotaxis protein
VDNEILILLVEDEPLVSLSLQDALEEGGYAVAAAPTGQEALVRLGDSHPAPSGLVTDIRLGAGMDGWEIARAARERYPEIAVVYMTGDSAADYSSHGVPDSVMLQKPFANAQVVTAISTLLNKAMQRGS